MGYELTCKDCKHACYYPCHWWYPFLDPYCEVTKLSIQYDTPVCDDFELLGRLSR